MAFVNYSSSLDDVKSIDAVEAVDNVEPCAVTFSLLSSMISLIPVNRNEWKKRGKFIFFIIIEFMIEK